MFIQDMLREELENSVQIKQDYIEAIASLPKGSLVRKRISGHDYVYLIHAIPDLLEADGPNPQVSSHISTLFLNGGKLPWL